MDDKGTMGQLAGEVKEMRWFCGFCWVSNSDFTAGKKRIYNDVNQDIRMRNGRADKVVTLWRF
jgi:hypothetical protein